MDTQESKKTLHDTADYCGNKDADIDAIPSIKYQIFEVILHSICDNILFLPWLSESWEGCLHAGDLNDSTTNSNTAAAPSTPDTQVSFAYNMEGIH